MTAPARGRRPGDSGTREAILEAAREQFGETGYRGTTMRSVAAAAGVDPRLVTHYFGSKQALFRASVAFPVEAEERVQAAFDAMQLEDDPGRRTATIMVSLLEDHEVRGVMIGLIRAASSEPEAADLIREVLTESKLPLLAASVGGERSELRAAFVASQLVGLLMARYIVGIGPLAEASPEQLVSALTPVLDHYVRGDWIEGSST